MALKPQFDKLLGGDVEAPIEVDPMRFATARSQEIADITRALEDTKKGNLIFQRLPRHMRRRVMGHSAKRMPRNLRDAYTQQILKSSGGLSSKHKTPSRKHRRRPANLLDEYNRRQRQFAWLETHIWHAKRFHMTERWGYRLALYPNDRSYRACYRATANHCLLQDVSFLGCIELEGPFETILTGLSKHTDPSLGLTFSANSLRCGSREGDVMFYENNQFPWNPIGKISFFWKPCEMLVSSQSRNLWIWAHPAFYQRIVDALIVTFKMSSVPVLEQQSDHDKADNLKRQSDDDTTSTKKKIKCKNGTSRDVEEVKLATRNVPFERTPKYLSSCGNVRMILLKDTLNRFRLIGPLSQAVLQEALQLVNISHETSFSDSNQKTDENLQLAESANSSDSTIAKCAALQSHHNFWLSSKGFASPAELAPRIIVSLVVSDPRLQIPDKRTKAVPLTEGIRPGNVCLELPASIFPNPLWSSCIRDTVTKSKLSAAELNTLRSNLLVPGLLRTVKRNHDLLDFKTYVSKGEPLVNSQIPVMLVQRPGSQNPSKKRLGFGCGWDIILPAGWGMPFWLAFIFRCARSSGLREAASHELESGLCGFLPPDSIAGFEEESRKGKEMRETYFRLPPDKRPNYIKLGVACPFQSDWSKLVRDWILPMQQSSNFQDHQILSQSNQEKFFVLRNKEILQEINSFLETTWSVLKGISQGQRIFSDAMISRMPNFCNQESCLVPVCVEALQKGVTEDQSLICIPLPEDISILTHGGVLPVESPHVDNNHDQRYSIRNEHKKLLLRLRRQRVRARRKQEEESSDNENLVPKEKDTSPTQDLVTSFNEKMEKLWLLDTKKVGSVRNSGSRETAGFVLRGNFSFSEARGCGVGYITYLSLTKLIEVWLRYAPSSGTSLLKSKGVAVLVRSPNSYQYRLAKLSING